MGSRGRFLVQLAWDKAEKAEKARNENNTDTTANNPTGYATASTTEQRGNGLPGSVACDGYNNSFDENTQVMDPSEPASAHVPVPDTNGIPRLVYNLNRGPVIIKK